MSGHPRLLLADDDPQKRSLLAHFLQIEFPDLALVECISGAEAIATLERIPIDAVVTNHSMRPVDGVELVRWIRRHRPGLPVVMVTGSPLVAQEALDAGVNRVLDTSAYQRVGPLIRTYLENRPGRS